MPQRSIQIRCRDISAPGTGPAAPTPSSAAERSTTTVRQSFRRFGRLLARPQKHRRVGRRGPQACIGVGRVLEA